MTELRLDNNVRKLLESHLDSFEKLEIARALRAGGRAMTTSELEVACRFTTDTVREALENLSRSGVIGLDTQGSLASLGPTSHDPAFEALMTIYEADRASVLSILATISVGRIRSMAARAFANAFVLRKKRDDGDG